METMDPDEMEVYKFLGVEQADCVITKVVFERIKSEIEERIKMLVNTELNGRNLISAINVKVIPVAAYAINVCKFSKAELNVLDKIVKKELRSKQMLGKQASDERLYLKRENGRRGLKSMRDVYKETRLQVACYMSKSENRWNQAVWKRKTWKVENTRTWKRVKTAHQQGTKQMRSETYQSKDQQSRFLREQEEECHLWLTQNLHLRKTSWWKQDLGRRPED